MLCCAKSSTEDLVFDVVLLDASTLSYKDNVHFKKDDKAQDIFDIVCNHLGLVEKDYFGLYYYDKESQPNWLDLYRRFGDHKDFGKIDGLHKLYFAVRFFIPDPTSLNHRVTRHQFFLQLKRDLKNGDLECDFKKLTELAALALQSEIGDYKADQHRPGYVSNFKLVKNQGEAFNHEVEYLHGKYVGLPSEKAKHMFLRKCCRLETYGVDMHTLEDEFGNICVLGLSSKGIEVRKNKRKVKTYYWPLINHIEFKQWQLKIQVKHRNGEDSIYMFTAKSRSACKRIWKRAIEQHAFFRMTPAYGTMREKDDVSPSHGGTLTDNRTESKSEKGHEISSPDLRKVNENGAEPTTPGKNHDNLLETQGLFGKNVNVHSRNMYVTPKSERRERNRHLRSLSDSENKHHKTRSRHGRSSGEESDTHSKRRLSKSRNQQRGASKWGAYHTDTEAVSRNYIRKDTTLRDGVSEYERPRYDSLSDAKSTQSKRRRMKKSSLRLSKEDMNAQKMLWQHIQQESETSKDYTQDQMRDIPYTEVKTDGNPLPMKLRRHRQQSTSPSQSVSSLAPSKISPKSGGLVSPLEVTTALARDDVAFGKRTLESPRHKSPASHRTKHDWDSKRNYRAARSKRINENVL